MRQQGLICDKISACVPVVDGLLEEGQPCDPMVFPASLVTPATAPERAYTSGGTSPTLSPHPLPLLLPSLPPSPYVSASLFSIFFGPPSFVDYIKFCGAVEPKNGGRDLDNQRRVLDKAWKAKPKESTSKIIPSSGGAPSRQQHSTRHPLSERGWEGDEFGGGREHTQSVRFH